MTKVVNKGELRKEKGGIFYFYSHSLVKINGTSAKAKSAILFISKA